ncbi:MAG TPA: zf-HC2 domain-containing protein [Bryobacteraceae bacterium]|nr:zf-HC2 domain-containing protein [Bryobacteraceae bacterium]
MNTVASHPRDEMLERYAMGISSESDCEFVEEHLLVCPPCQKRLEEVDEFLQVLTAALSISIHDPPGARLRYIQIYKILIAASAASF